MPSDNRQKVTNLGSVKGEERSACSCLFRNLGHSHSFLLSCCHDFGALGLVIPIFLKTKNCIINNLAYTLCVLSKTRGLWLLIAEGEGIK